MHCFPQLAAKTLSVAIGGVGEMLGGLAWVTRVTVSIKSACLLQQAPDFPTAALGLSQFGPVSAVTAIHVLFGETHPTGKVVALAASQQTQLTNPSGQACRVARPVCITLRFMWEHLSLFVFAR